MEIKETMDYNKFKRLAGNRDVEAPRVKKIISSINEIGPQPMPILVNEKFEVIDGQGRLEAFKKLHLPVYYIMKAGLGIKHCIKMNINQTPWNLLDYVQCYAEKGNESYQYMLRLYNDYPKANLNIISSALFRCGKSPARAIKGGRISVTEEMYNQAKERLDFATALIDNISTGHKKLNGSILTLMQVLTYCYDYEEIDKERLAMVLERDAHQMNSWRDLESCFKELEIIYNFKSKTRVRMLNLFEDDERRKANIEPDYSSNAFEYGESEGLW